MSWLSRRKKNSALRSVSAEGQGRLGIIAGSGTLPVLLAEAYPDAYCLSFEGTDCSLTDAILTRYRYEKLGSVFTALRAEGVTRIVMAGATTRPVLDMKQLDLTVMALAPRILKAMSGGRDDALLRLVISVFEEQGFAVVGAHDLLPDLTAQAGVLSGVALSKHARADSDRGREILDGLAPLDVSQACVVAGGMCLGIETIQGTDAMLRFAASTPDRLRRGKGVLCKFPKSGQDLRVDMPAIGPETLRRAAEAGLEGIVIAAGRVLLIERKTLLSLSAELGVSIIAVEV
jgi:UDP-2,3-diacylglucosamine hydrolase